MTKEIKLTQEKVALVDDEDYEELSKYKWRVMKNHGVLYAGRTNLNSKVKTILMHRQITKHNCGLQVDHINHNTLDNRKSNLRICTNSQNGMNRKKILKIGISSKYKGVYNTKRGEKKWFSSIKLNKKQIYLGCYYTEIEAALAYNKAAIDLFGEFAYINNIEQ